MSTATGRWTAITSRDTSWEEPCYKKGKPSRFNCSSSVFNCIAGQVHQQPWQGLGAKTQQALVIGEEVYFLSGKNEWQIGIVTGTTDTGRSYNILSDKGTSLRRNRSHLKPRCHDIPVISCTFPCKTSTSSQSEITENRLSGPQHPPKVKYSYNNKQNISFQDHYEQHPPKVKYSLPGLPHPPKVKYFPESVPKLVIRWVGDTAYDSYIAETLYPLKSAIKPKKHMRFAGNPVSSVKTRSHPPKWTIKAEDPDLLIPIELSQARAESDLIQDLGGDLSDVMSPRKSHNSEETLPNIPLGQIQAQRSDDTTTNNIAHSKTDTPSQSEINSTITENIVTSQTSTPSQREIFSETGTGTSSSEDVSHSDGDIPEEHPQHTGTQSEHRETSDSSGTSRTTTSSQSEIFSGYNNIYNNSSDCKTYTSSQSEITAEYDANSEPSSREASRPSAPESGNLSVRTVYSPTPEMAVIYRTMHDAIHTVRDQQGRAVTRSLLNQQKALAASKLQCNIQIKRSSTPEHPPMSNVPPRWARARLEKANGVTSGSSEESDCEPQTSRMAWFQALKRQFETPTKSKEESPSHRTIKRQRLFWKTSSQSATDCPSKEYHTPEPSRRLNGTASEGDWARPSSQEDQLQCRYCT